MPYLRAHKVKGHSHWLGIALAERDKPGDAGNQNLDSLIPIYSIFLFLQIVQVIGVISCIKLDPKNCH